MYKKENHVVELPFQGGLQFYFDKERAIRVFDTLIKWLSEKRPPYNYAHVPQAAHFRPINLKGSREMANYYLVGDLWMRGGTESDTALKQLKKLHENHPEYFNPEMFEDRGRSYTEGQIRDLGELMEAYKLPRIKENAPGWVYNLRKLNRYWAGDTRLIFSDQPSFTTILQRLMGETMEEGEFINEDSPYGFRFHRKKMSAMLPYFLMSLKLIHMNYIPVPLDVHCQSLIAKNEILRVRGMRRRQAIGVNFYVERALNLGRDITEWYCRYRKVSPVALCDTLWLLSRNFCRDNPGNSGMVIDLKRQEATKKKREEQIKERKAEEDASYYGKLVDVSEYERTWETVKEIEEMPFDALEGRKRYLGLKWTAEDLQSSPNLVAKFQRSCGNCQLAPTCSYNTSSSGYYVGGKLIAERLRVIPRIDQVNFLVVPEFEDTYNGRIDPTIRFATISFEDAAEENRLAIEKQNACRV